MPSRCTSSCTSCVSDGHAAAAANDDDVSCTGNAVDDVSCTGSAVDDVSGTENAVDDVSCTGSAVNDVSCTGNAVDDVSCTGNAVDDVICTGNAVYDVSCTGNAVDDVSCTGSAVDDDISCTGNAVDASSAVCRDEAPTVVAIPIVANALSFDESLAVETQRLDELADTETRRDWTSWRTRNDGGSGVAGATRWTRCAMRWLCWTDVERSAAVAHSRPPTRPLPPTDRHAADCRVCRQTTSGGSSTLPVSTSRRCGCRWSVERWYWASIEWRRRRSPTVVSRRRRRAAVARGRGTSGSRYRQLSTWRRFARC